MEQKESNPVEETGRSWEGREHFHSPVRIGLKVTAQGTLGNRWMFKKKGSAGMAFGRGRS